MSDPRQRKSPSGILCPYCGTNHYDPVDLEEFVTLRGSAGCGMEFECTSCGKQFDCKEIVERHWITTPTQ